MGEHLVYFHPDKPNGYGATTSNRWPKRLIEQGLDITKGRIVEKDLTLEQADQIERDLQIKDGYTVDISGYKRAYTNCHGILKRKDIRKKADKGNSESKKGKIPTHMVNARRRPIWAINIHSGQRTHYISYEAAAKELNLFSSGIANVLKYPHCKTYKGYTFEYGSRII